jgi:hypothetical protein
MSLRPSARQHAVASAPAAASSVGVVAPEYVYQQHAPSVIENVISTILHPGVNAQTFSVLNVTLIVLFIIISLMLFAFDGIASRFRFHLWIFLAVCFSLLISVNWFFVRYQSYGGDSDDDEEEEERPKPKKKATTVAAKKATRKSTKVVEEEEDDDAPSSNADHTE